MAAISQPSAQTPSSDSSAQHAHLNDQENQQDTGEPIDKDITAAPTATSHQEDESVPVTEPVRKSSRTSRGRGRGRGSVYASLSRGHTESKSRRGEKSNCLIHVAV